MTAEYSSLLGYVFIISGIALAIIAYAIHLNLRESKSIISSSKTEKEPERLIGFSSPTELKSQMDQNENVPPSQLDLGSPFETPPRHKEDLNKQTYKLEKIGGPMPEKQELTSVATILREVDTGNLIIRVGGTDYNNVDELKDSPYWSRIERLHSELTAWLKSSKATKSGIRSSSSVSKSMERESTAPKSMVEEINQILELKLKTENVGRKAIKIIEGLDGSVKVYIGVDSYPIDEVPFEDVRILIREAVTEWEENR